MNEIEEVKAEIKTVAINLESYQKENDSCNEETQAYLNDMADQLNTIQYNHLAHIKADIEGNAKDIKWLKWVIGIGLTALAILTGAPSIISLVLQLGQI